MWGLSAERAAKIGMLGCTAIVIYWTLGRLFPEPASPKAQAG